jgi:hypothetical protein
LVTVPQGVALFCIMELLWFSWSADFTPSVAVREFEIGVHRLNFDVSPRSRSAFTDLSIRRSNGKFLANPPRARLCPLPHPVRARLALQRRVSVRDRMMKRINSANALCRASA